MRVTSLLPLIHLLFGPIEAERTWKEDGTRLFSVEGESDRLAVGPIDTQDGGAIFGIARVQGALSLSPIDKPEHEECSPCQDKPSSEMREARAVSNFS